MDNIDVKILRLLQANARITASEIAGEVSLSVPAVSERLKKLETSGIIRQYTAIIDPERLDKNLMAIMFITLERPKYSESFVESVKGMNEILECHYLAGDHDYALKIMTENTASLQELLNKIKSVQGVQKTRTIIVLSTAKQNYSIIPEDLDRNV